MERILVTGVYKSKTDSQGRITLPRIFRPQILEKCENTLFLSAHSEFLIALPPYELEQALSRIGLMEYNDMEQRSERRRLTAALHMVAVDGQGRIKIPDSILCRPLFEEGAVFVGTGHDFEIWDEGEYEERRRAENRNSVRKKKE